MRRPLAGATLIAFACALTLFDACTRSGARFPHGADGPAPVAAEASRLPVAPPGEFYAFRAGMPVRVATVVAATASFEPWTVQSRAAGFLAIGSQLYIAVNGWGVVALPEPAKDLADRPAFRGFEERGFFGERTINGFFVDGGDLLLSLYRNTVFRTKAPQTPSLAFVRFDVATGSMTPVELPASRKGWEAVDVVRAAAGTWALAWKRSTQQRTEFRFSLYSPDSGEEKSIDRTAFFASYGFVDIAQAPRALRNLARLAAAGERRRWTSSDPLVLHLQLRGTPYERVERFRMGSERRLAAGDARLVTVPVVRSAGRFFALLPGGRVLWVSEATGSQPRELRLPTLPAHFVYTDFWTDGRSLVASWEQQRFPEVGAAGIYRAALSELPAVPVVGRSAR